MGNSLPTRYFHRQYRELKPFTATNGTGRMRYFVTGGTGFIGSWVVQLLVEKGEEVCCLVRKTSNLRWLKDLPIQYHYGSLLEPDSLKDGVKDADYVLHIAGVTKALTVADYYRGNVEATRNLLQVVQETNSRLRKFVFVGSQAAIGPSPSPEPLTEDSPPHPVTDYGKSKLQAEQAVREFMERLPITILRPPAVYGPRDTDVFEVFRNIRRGINVKVGRTDQLVSIIHVLDLARAILLAAEHPDSTGQTYFVCNDTPCAWSEVIAILQRLMQRRARTIAIPYPVAYAFAGILELAARVQRKPTILNRQKIREVSCPYWVISNEKIRRELGYASQFTLEEGLRNTLEWYRAEGWL
ncbi:MAG: NAD-dependent epimerase/dehydratase family protein [Calditrichaeota bacterium]|nr:MAG: NAD-dependent epimerase/dehydratase family protein [Calditrichota bacterium]